MRKIKINRSVVTISVLSVAVIVCLFTGIDEVMRESLLKVFSAKEYAMKGDVVELRC